MRHDELNRRDDQFDMSEAALSLSIALLGVSVLARKGWLFLLGLVLGMFGATMAVAGFAGLDLHPGWLARLLS